MLSIEGTEANHSRRGFLRMSGLAVIAAGGLLAAGAHTADATQGLWRWCERCQGLWFSGSGTWGSCPAGDIFDGGHHGNGSGDYRLKADWEGGAGQTPWRWCGKCQGLFFGDGGGGRCPAGGAVPQHLPFSDRGVISGSYRIETITDNDGGSPQRNWWFCWKCTGLFFAGNRSLGRCPSDGGTHALDTTRSGEYVLRGA